MLIFSEACYFLKDVITQYLTFLYHFVNSKQAAVNKDEAAKHVL